MKTYLKDSARTVAENFYPEEVSNDLFHVILDEAIFHLVDVDRVKKALFYKKLDDGLRPIDTEVSLNKAFYADEGEKDILHALLGIATEAGELLECVFDGNRASLIDEAGDILWYLALLFRTLGVTFEEVAEKNLAKLRIRFPDRFEEEKAVNRDESAEKSVFSD